MNNTNYSQDLREWEKQYLEDDKTVLEQPKDYLWLIIGILTPLAIGSIIFFIWYLNLIINLPLPL